MIWHFIHGGDANFLERHRLPFSCPKCVRSGWKLANAERASATWDGPGSGPGRPANGEGGAASLGRGG